MNQTQQNQTQKPPRSPPNQIKHEILHKPIRTLGAQGKRITCYESFDKPQMTIVLSKYFRSTDKFYTSYSHRFYVTIRNHSVCVYGQPPVHQQFYYTGFAKKSPPIQPQSLFGYSNRLGIINEFIVNASKRFPVENTINLALTLPHNQLNPSNHHDNISPPTINENVLAYSEQITTQKSKKLNHLYNKRFHQLFTRWGRKFGIKIPNSKVHNAASYRL